jgi:hypothetical protein
LTLASKVDAGQVTTSELADWLDRLSPASRTAECLALSADQQKRLWQMASALGSGPSGGSLLANADGETAVFAGRNSLRIFTRFEKWFSRQGSEIVGCNRHVLGWFTGPGYFTVQEDSRSSGLRFDYGRVPSREPAGWPRVAGNSGILSGPVYGGLLDEVAWVSADVLIGSAMRRGTPLDSYFVLTRAEL